MIIGTVTTADGRTAMLDDRFRWKSKDQSFLKLLNTRYTVAEVQINGVSPVAVPLEHQLLQMVVENLGGSYKAKLIGSDVKPSKS